MEVNKNGTLSRGIREKCNLHGIWYVRSWNEMTANKKLAVAPQLFLFVLILCYIFLLFAMCYFAGINSFIFKLWRPPMNVWMSTMAPCRHRMFVFDVLWRRIRIVCVQLIFISFKIHFSSCAWMMLKIHVDDDNLYDRNECCCDSF